MEEEYVSILSCSQNDPLEQAFNTCKIKNVICSVTMQPIDKDTDQYTDKENANVGMVYTACPYCRRSPRPK